MKERRCDVKNSTHFYNSIYVNTVHNVTNKVFEIVLKFTWGTIIFCILTEYHVYFYIFIFSEIFQKTSNVKMADIQGAIQSGSSKVKCNVCFQYYASIGSLRVHMDNVHQNHKHKCDICEKSFGRPWKLADHIKSTHDKIKPIKINECELCGKCFEKIYLIKQKSQLPLRFADPLAETVSTLPHKESNLTIIRAAFISKGSSNQGFSCT